MFLIKSNGDIQFGVGGGKKQSAVGNLDDDQKTVKQDKKGKELKEKAKQDEKPK